MFYSIHIHARKVNELIDLKSEKEQHHTHSKLKSVALTIASA